MPPVELRVYQSPERRGRILWSSLASTEGACRGQPEDASSAGEGVHDGIGCHYPVPQILGDSLPSAAYKLEAVLRLVEDTLVYPGEYTFLSADTMPIIGGRSAIETHLRFDSHAAVVESLARDHPSEGPWLQIVATARNTGDRRVQLLHGECPLTIALSSTGDASKQVLWKQEEGSWCADIALIEVVAPGELAEITRTNIPVKTILGDSLPPGSYELEIELDLSSALPSEPRKGGVYEDTIVPLETHRVRLPRDSEPWPLNWIR